MSITAPVLTTQNGISGSFQADAPTPWMDLLFTVQDDPPTHHGNKKRTARLHPAIATIKTKTRKLWVTTVITMRAGMMTYNRQEGGAGQSLLRWRILWPANAMCPRSTFLLLTCKILHIVLLTAICTSQVWPRVAPEACQAEHWLRAHAHQWGPLARPAPEPSPCRW